MMGRGWRTGGAVDVAVEVVEAVVVVGAAGEAIVAFGGRGVNNLGGAQADGDPVN